MFKKQDKPKTVMIEKLSSDQLMGELLSRTERTGQADVNFDYSYEQVMDQLHLIITLDQFKEYFDVELVKWSAHKDQPEYNKNEDVIKVFKIYKALKNS